MGLINESDEYNVVSYEEFNDTILDLATLDLEDEQVRTPNFNPNTDKFLTQVGKVVLYTRNRDGLPSSGSYEMFIENFNDDIIGFIRGTKKDNLISFNLIYIEPDSRGMGIGTDIYEYFLNNGYIVKSDSEITDSTYSLYTNLAKSGYKPLIFNDGRVGLMK